MDYEAIGWRITDEHEVLSKLESHRPLAYYFQTKLKGSLRWSEHCSGIKTTLYCPIQPEFKDGLIIDVRGPVYSAAVFWPYEDFSVLSSALRGDYIIDWRSQPKMFFGISKTLYEPLEKTVKSLGLDNIISFELQTHFMDQERARNITIEGHDDVTIKRLDVKHAPVVHSAWLGVRQEALALVEDMIRINHSVGIFLKNDPEPISWILECFYGLGSLHTVPEHRLKGYGALSLKYMSKILGEEGKNVTAMVHYDNLEVNKLFRKVGFQPSGILKVIQTFDSTTR